MVRIAIAGGTGGLGRTLVEELMQGKDHEIFILSRKSTLSFQVPSNVHILKPPYTDLSALTSLLTTHSIHTLISVLNPPTPELHAIELNLIHAAAASPTVKRFIPSEWGVDFATPDSQLPLPPPWKDLKREALAELRKYPNGGGRGVEGKLEYTLVHNGFFMDYFGMPHVNSYMSPEVPFIDIQACQAAIPGTGDESKVVWTYTKDVAKLVRKLVEMPEGERWDEKSVVVGDKVTMNEVLEVAERVRGKKFDVTHDSLENLRNGKITEIPAYIPAYEVLPKEFMLGMMAAFGIAMITGVFDFSDDTLNKNFPDVETVKMGELIEKAWKGK